MPSTRITETTPNTPAVTLTVPGQQSNNSASNPNANNTTSARPSELIDATNPAVTQGGAGTSIIHSPARPAMANTLISRDNVLNEPICTPIPSAIYPPNGDAAVAMPQRMCCHHAVKPRNELYRILHNTKVMFLLSCSYNFCSTFSYSQSHGHCRRRLSATRFSLLANRKRFDSRQFLKHLGITFTRTYLCSQQPERHSSTGHPASRCR